MCMVEKHRAAICRRVKFTLTIWVGNLILIYFKQQFLP